MDEVRDAVVDHPPIAVETQGEALDVQERYGLVVGDSCVVDPVLDEPPDLVLGEMGLANVLGHSFRDRGVGNQWPR
jgi:hypothetical protein